jgi:hypothetical protein
MSCGKARLRLQSGACCTSPLPCFGSRKKPTRPVQNKIVLRWSLRTQKVCYEKCHKKLVTEYLLKISMVCILLVKILQESWISKIIRIRITVVSVPVPDPAWTRIPLASNIIYDNGEEFALQQTCRYKFGFSLFSGAEAIYHQTF